MEHLNIILIVVVAALTVLSYFKGKGVLFSLIISFYPASIIYLSFPYKAKFLFSTSNSLNTFYSHAFIYLVFFILSFFVSKKIVHADGTHSGVGGFFEALLLSISVVILTTALAFHILPYRDIYNLGTEIQTFLSSDLGYFISVISPMAVVYWMTRRYYY
jgi:hypothetical protein